MCGNLIQQLAKLGGPFVARPSELGVTQLRLLYCRHICQRQLRHNCLDVRDWVDLASHVDDVVVLEAAHHVQDAIGLTNIGKKLIPKALAFGGAGHQPSNVNKLRNGVLHFLWLHNVGQRLHSRIRNLHDAYVGLDGAEGIILCRNTRLS